MSKRSKRPGVKPSTDIIHAPTGELPTLTAMFSADNMPGFNHDERRKAKLAERRRRKGLVLGGVVTEAMIPPGSLLSDDTLERIRRGEYRILSKGDRTR